MIDRKLRKSVTASAFQRSSLPGYAGDCFGKQRLAMTLGQEIRTLVDRPYQAGYHSVRWDSKDNHGNTVASGIYLYHLKAGEFTQVKKMSLLR